MREFGQTKCRACGKRLRRDNASGYCKRHWRLAQPQSARAPCVLCGKPLRSDSPGREHAVCAARRGAFLPLRSCLRCGKPLASYNVSGYCHAHSHNARRDRLRARARLRRAALPPECRVE